MVRSPFPQNLSLVFVFKEQRTQTPSARTVCIDTDENNKLAINNLSIINRRRLFSFLFKLADQGFTLSIKLFLIP